MPGTVQGAGYGKIKLRNNPSSEDANLLAKD